MRNDKFFQKEVSANAKTWRFGDLKISVFRGWRGAWFKKEVFRGDGIRWLNVSWSHPLKHVWWARSVYLTIHPRCVR